MYISCGPDKVARDAARKESARLEHSWLARRVKADAAMTDGNNTKASISQLLDEAANLGHLAMAVYARNNYDNRLF